MSERQLHRAYLALGSNIDAEQNLRAAVHLLTRFGKIAAVSQVWESDPVGFTDQPRFLNAAVLLMTELGADELCRQAIPQIEIELGRVRDPNNKNAPRTIDIDLVLFDDEVGTIGGRQIPDPDILTRLFVAVPLAELSQEYVHPVAHLTLKQIAQDFAPLPTTMRMRMDVSLSSNAPSTASSGCQPPGISSAKTHSDVATTPKNPRG